MKNMIRYTTEPPENFNQLLTLYESCRMEFTWVNSGRIGADV